MLVGEIFARMRVDDKQFEQDLSRLEGVTKKKATTLGGIFKGAFSFAFGMGLVQGFRSLTGAVTDFVNTAARTEMLDAALRAVANSSGYAVQSLREQQKVMRDLGIAEQESTQILTRFMQAQLDVTQASELARVAQDAAVIAGYNSSEAAEQMTEAIAKQQPRLLMAFGMMGSLEDIYGQYAKTLGKTTSQLNSTEKKQAMLNYILKEGEKIAGTYETAMGTVGKKIGSLKRFWDTLKNALAKPLALPALGVIVDGLTEALRTAVDWAEANEQTLRMWGQTASNVLQSIGSGFVRVAGFISQHWQQIRFAVIMMMTYAAATRAAASAKGILLAITTASSGQLLSQIPILSMVSTAMGIYRVQMALAASQGVVLTGVLARLRVAIFSVYAALGPLGWVLLGLSALVAGGYTLWNRYAQSLNKATAVNADVGSSAARAAKATDQQADSIKKAGKAAAKSLQSFDEIHQLQKDSGGRAGAGSDLEPFDMNLGGLSGGIPALDFGDMLGSIQDNIPTISGFFGWIWEGVKRKWNGFKKWSFGWGKHFADVFMGNWTEFIVWGANLWEGAKVKWGNFTNWVSDKWSKFKTNTRNTWEDIKSSVQSKWNELKTSAPATWESIRSSIQNRWNALKSNSAITWNEIRNTIQARWNELKSSAPSTWESIRSSITGKWNSLKTSAANIWDGIKNTIKSRVDSIKGMFNFQWSMPRIKLPSFSVSWDKSGFWGKVGEFLGLPGKPIMDVKWLAKGGIVTGPTLAMMGEAGPEAVIPLSRSGFSNDLAQAVFEAVRDGMKGQGSDGNSGPIEITLYMDKTAVGKITARSLKDLQRQSGGVLLPL